MDKVKRPNIFKRLIIIIIAVVFFLAAVYYMGLINNEKLKRDAVIDEYEAEKMKLEELNEKYYDSETDDDYIIELARERGYAFPDEEVYYNSRPNS